MPSRRLTTPLPPPQPGGAQTWRLNGISIKTQTPNIFRRDIYTRRTPLLPIYSCLSFALGISSSLSLSSSVSSCLFLAQSACCICCLGLDRCQVDFNFKLIAKAHWEKHIHMTPTHTLDTHTHTHVCALSLFGWQKCCFWLIMASFGHGTALLAKSGLNCRARAALSCLASHLHGRHSCSLCMQPKHTKQKKEQH